MKRQTALSHHVVQFARFLRSKQFNLGPNEEADALLGLTTINWHSPEQFKQVLKTTFCKAFEQTLVFDQLYFEYWAELAKAVDSKTKDVPQHTDKPKQSAPSIQVIKQWLHGKHQPTEAHDIHKASADTLKGTANLMAVANDHTRQWREVVQLIQRYVAKKKTRRMVKSHKPAMVDFRTILKRSMLRGGDIHQLAYKKKKVSKTNIVLLCDVSKSMELYSKFVIQMMYALQNSSLRIHCYVFSTSLHAVSKTLKRQRLADALKAITDEVDEWHSGTQIGNSLQQFLTQHGKKVLTKNTFTFVVSDGWDGGNIKTLEHNLRQLKHKSEQLLWVNPLAPSSHFNPEVLGMKAAMPYIDHLVPALDVTSLKKHLMRLA